MNSVLGAEKQTLGTFTQSVKSNYFMPTYEGLKNRSNSSGDFTNHDSYHILDVEIDEACGKGVLCGGEPKDIQLYKFSDIPVFLRGNPYVIQGYRVSLPFSSCIKSLFMLNNETINIWSHLLGFFLFLTMTVYDNVFYIPNINGTLVDHIIITVALFCFQFCMLCSTGYHIFVCHSERACRRWLSMDITGICIGIIGIYLPGVHYAFYCLSIWRDLYLLIITVLCVSVLAIQLNPHHFITQRWMYRVFLLIALVAFGVIPAGHWMYLSGGWSEELVQIFIPKVAVMYLLLCLAFVFYTTKFPERCFPGKFDFVGSSHQLWHIILVLAMWYWHGAGREILAYRTSVPCLH